MGSPRVVLHFDVPDAEFRLVYTGAGYQMQEGRYDDEWAAVPAEDSFSLLASLVDPEDSEETHLIGAPVDWPRRAEPAGGGGADA